MSNRDRFLKLMERIYDLCGDSSREAARWLSESARALDGSTDMDMIMSGRMDVVENLLLEFKSGTVT